MNQKPKVIIVTGPCGVGKTRITALLAEQLAAKLLSGDKIKEKLFPEISNITLYPVKLKVIKAAIFEQSKKYYYAGKTVVIDYVILGSAYILQFQKEFKEDLLFKVLLPKREIIYQRDKNRECWTSGKECIDELYEKYLGLSDLIGEENYIDNEKETPRMTANRILGDF